MIKLIVSDGAVVIDFDDDIVEGMTITHDGVNRLAQPKEA